MQKRLKFVLISPKNRTVYNFRGDLLKEIMARGFEVVVTGPNLDDIDKIKDLGVRFKLLKLNKTGINLISDLAYFVSLYRFLKVEKPDVTLGYTIKPVIYGSVAARLAKVPNINAMITGIGYTFTARSFKARILRNIVSILYRIALHCSHTVIFQNPDDKQEFISRKLIVPEKCKIVTGSGVNMDYFRPAPFPEKISFFMLSRIMYSKGIIEYLEAARAVKAKYPEVRCMLLGASEGIQDSIPMRELMPFIHDHTIEHFDETNDVRSFYQLCSVYVLPSYREGTPRTVLEAMAMGRPIITTDAPGCRETVIDGQSGFLVPIQDNKSIAKKMEWFICHPEQIPIMGMESLKLCQSKFDVRKVNQNMLNILGIKHNGE